MACMSIFSYDYIVDTAVGIAAILYHFDQEDGLVHAMAHSTECYG